MELEYRFPNLPELKNLKIVMNNDSGKIRATVRGTSSLRTWFLIKTRYALQNSIGFIKTPHEGNVFSMYHPPCPSPADARMAEAFLSSMLLKRLVPMAATIGVTANCQCQCMHCSAKKLSKTKTILTTDELKEVSRQCVDLGIVNITFTGGEPLLRTDLEEVISSVPLEKAITLVFTNALGLTTKRVQSLKRAGLFGVHISLDSAEPSEHDRLRGYQGTFQAVEQGVKNALKAGLLVGISTYVTKDKALNHDILPIAELCAQWGVHQISVFDAIQTGGLMEQEGISLDKEARKVLLKDSNRINKKFKGRTRVVTQSWTNSGQGYSRFIGCLAANWQLHINAQGDFTPCDFTPLSFGNPREESLKDLWEKITKHPDYCYRKQTCRMQDPDFRRKYIETIPKGADLPYPISKL